MLSVREESCIRYYHLLDVVMFFMAVVVVAIHTQPLIDCSNLVLRQVFDLISHCAVPFFFLRSGFFLQQKIVGKERDCALNAIKKYTKRIIKLYVFWTIAYLPLAIYGFYINDTPVLKSCFYYVLGFLFVGEQFNSWILWYLLSMIYALCLIFLLKKMNAGKLMFIFVACFFYGISVGVDLIVANQVLACQTTNLFFNMLEHVINTFGNNGRLFTGVFFMVVGMLIAKLKIPHVVSVTLLFISVFWNRYGGPYFLNCILFSTALFLICKEVNGSKKIRLCLYLRRISISTYFIHLWVWTIFYLIVYGVKKFGAIPFLATISITILLSVLYLFWRGQTKRLLQSLAGSSGP